MSRNADGLRTAIGRCGRCARNTGTNVNVPGSGEELNQQLENAGRVADFFELGELMCLDALHRNESCGGHFREEFQTEDGEALRDDEHYQYVGRLGIHGTGCSSGSEQGAAGIRIRASVATELQE